MVTSVSEFVGPPCRSPLSLPGLACGPFLSAGSERGWGVATKVFLSGVVSENVIK